MHGITRINYVNCRISSSLHTIKIAGDKIIDADQADIIGIVLQKCDALLNAFVPCAKCEFCEATRYRNAKIRKSKSKHTIAELI